MRAHAVNCNYCLSVDGGGLVACEWVVQVDIINEECLNEWLREERRKLGKEEKKQGRGEEGRRGNYFTICTFVCSSYCG